MHAFRNPSCVLKQLLRDRGPDHVDERQAFQAPYKISFIATVLALRGTSIAAQPFSDIRTGSILCWNGEAWRIGSDILYGNDGETIFHLLTKEISVQRTDTESTTAVLKVLRSISGPFAFVFLDCVHHHVYFGRDRLGRRSLLYNTNNCPQSIEFSSVADPASGTWKEVDCDGIYQLSLREDFHDQPQDPVDHFLYTSFLPVRKLSWSPAFSVESCGIGVFNKTLPMTSYVLDSGSRSVEELRRQLCESLKIRILDIPTPPRLEKQSTVRLAVLFSGGLDCSVLARLAHDILPYEFDIDLLNVAFENPRTLKTASAMRLGKTTAGEGHDRRENPLSIIQNRSWVEPSPYEACPDRCTGRRAFQELQVVCPGRLWRFVAVDVPYEEVGKHRQTVINLMTPHNTEMDLSIALALYFAARGSGMATTSSNLLPCHYTSPARVLLSGFGADELFGGYTRHATAYRRNGTIGLLEELELDITRLGNRNLGRDDRIISHWGKEPRFPYLDESLVKWAIESPIWDKCDISVQVADNLPQTATEIEPGKKVLRVLATKLGMAQAATERKRAIQFGARTANMGDEKRKGTALVT